MDQKAAEPAEPEPREPAGDQVVVGAIPREPPGFQSRPELLAQLDRGGDTGVSVLHAAAGTRGVGTTQLAAAYARAKQAAGWRLVAWVDAENAGTLRAGLAAVADAMRLSGGVPGLDVADPGQAVRRRLEADGDRSLLVFDDAGDPDVVRPFVPAGGTARVLITGDERSAASLGSQEADVPVDVFTTDEALAFLAARTGLADPGGAAEVAAELGCLPLALAQAAAMIAGQRLEYGTYLERLRALRTQQDQIPGPERYPPGTPEALLLALEALRAADLAGLYTGLMEIMAVLSAAGVRRDLLHAAGQAGALAGGRQIAAGLVDQALDRLMQRSLVTFSLDGQVIIAHRLVRGAVREGLARQGRLTPVRRAAASVLEARANALVGSRHRPAVRDLPDQVTALVANAAGPAGKADEELGRILLRLRFLALYHLIELGDSIPQAIAAGESLTADLERALGPGHPDTLNSQNSLAAAYRAAGRVDEAIRLFERTLVGRARVLGPGHPDTLNSQNSLAAAYQDAGRPAEAILMLELTLAAREHVLGAGHPGTLNSRGNLASAYRDAGRIDEAIPLFEQTLAARERALGPDHPDTLSARNNLARAYREAGRVAEAIPLLEQTLAARERTLGPDHLSTLGARHNLANAYLAAGRVAEAIPLHEQTLAACERLLGADHPRTLRARDSLANAYRDADRAE